MERSRTSHFFAEFTWPCRVRKSQTDATTTALSHGSTSDYLDKWSSPVFTQQSVLTENESQKRHNTFRPSEEGSLDTLQHNIDEKPRVVGNMGESGSLRRRASTLRRKSFLKTIFQKTKDGVHSGQEQETATTEKSGVLSRIRRAASMSQGRNRRPSTSASTALHDCDSHVIHYATTIPQIGTEAPKSSHILHGGAAARAAAAAQNERFGSARSLTLQDGLRAAERKISNDSESGIGIDLRDRPDEMVDLELPLARMDPSHILPEELLSHVMSFLDATSLMRSELVSRRWHGSASSDHAWRHMFERELGVSYHAQIHNSPASSIGGSGLGKRRPDQNWKRMWKVRKMLDNRWLKGQAAAIYLEGHKDSVYCVQFDEKKILTGSRDRTVRVWDAHTYECLKVLGVPKPVNVVPIIQEPLTNLAFRGSRPSVSIVPSRPRVEPLPPPAPAIHHHESILCLQFDKDIMVTGSSDHTCIVWEIKDDYTPIKQLRHHTAGVLDVCFDDKHIVSCSKDATICLWDRETGEFLRTLTGHRGPVNAVQLRGNLIVSASGDGIAKLWNLTSGLCIKEFPSKDRGMACVEFSPDSRTILAGGNDQVIYQFDANSGELIRELKGHKGLVRSLHLDSANGRVISGSYDTSVKAYDVNTGDMICDFAGWTTSWMLSAKADYRRIVATSQDSRAIIMDFGYQLPGIELLEN